MLCAEVDVGFVLALCSLSVTLLFQKINQRDIVSIQSYVDEVEIEFNFFLDQKFPEFNAKDKELLYLIKLDLITNGIIKVQNTYVSSVKSTKYRI